MERFKEKRAISGKVQIVTLGTAATDAANVGQVQAAVAGANAYTDTMFGKATSQIWSVAAAAQALANLPQAPNPGQSIMGVSMGSSHGNVAMAFGGSYFMRDRSVIVRASGSYGGGGGISGGVGVGIVFN